MPVLLPSGFCARRRAPDPAAAAAATSAKGAVGQYGRLYGLQDGLEHVRARDPLQALVQRPLPGALRQLRT